MALGAVAVIFLLWPKPAPEANAAQAPGPTCQLTDPQGLLGRLVSDPQGCINDIKSGAPVPLGEGKTAFIRYDGNTWELTGQALQNPKVTDHNVKVYSYGSVGLTITLHDIEGRSLYSSQATRGNAALLQLDFVDTGFPAGVTIDDSERGTFEVTLQ